jgi:predicted Zn finger-like uncharacterized protein
MIVTCASCLTKFNLNDSMVPPKGAKVRCSRCKHVFYVVPAPAEKKEEGMGDLAALAKSPEGITGREQKALPAAPALEEDGETGGASEMEEVLSAFEEKAKGGPPGSETEEPAKVLRTIRVARPERRGPSMVFALVFILLLIVFGIFYVSTELQSGGKLVSFLQSPFKKLSQTWGQLWGTETEGLVIGDFSRYEENVGGVPVSVIEGKVNNRSGVTKKFIRVKVAIYDKEKNRIAEKEALCGRLISRSEIKTLPSSPSKGELVPQPPNEGEMTTPPGRSTPFTIVFRDLPSDAKEFKIEVIEAPNL